MTDHLEDATRLLDKSRGSSPGGMAASAYLQDAVGKILDQLRSTPTAPARTEEGKSFADPTGTYADKRGTYAGQVEPSDALVEINQLCRVLAGRSDLDESGLYESAARVRDLLKAEGRSSAARELADWERWANGLSALILNKPLKPLPLRERITWQVEALERNLAGEIQEHDRHHRVEEEKDRELAELREKVRVLIEQRAKVAESLSRVHEHRHAVGCALFTATVESSRRPDDGAHLRPGSGSDEGKANGG